MQRRAGQPGAAGQQRAVLLEHGCRVGVECFGGGGQPVQVQIEHRGRVGRGRRMRAGVQDDLHGLGAARRRPHRPPWVSINAAEATSLCAQPGTYTASWNSTASACAGFSARPRACATSNISSTWVRSGSGDRAPRRGPGPGARSGAAGSPGRPAPPASPARSGHFACLGPHRLGEDFRRAHPQDRAVAHRLVDHHRREVSLEAAQAGHAGRRRPCSGGKACPARGPGRSASASVSASALVIRQGIDSTVAADHKAYG